MCVFVCMCIDLCVCGHIHVQKQIFTSQPPGMVLVGSVIDH